MGAQRAGSQVLFGVDQQPARSTTVASTWASSTVTTACNVDARGTAACTSLQSNSKVGTDGVPRVDKSGLAGAGVLAANWLGGGLSGTSGARTAGALLRLRCPGKGKSLQGKGVNGDDQAGTGHG
jgi:hypothetical protein